MPELQMDVAVANRFISSLSKSLQALCHGCMDFDSGIEIVGYINVNIDSGSKVDYVLNEKVLKSTTNSMTFVSNSFLARKEQPKQTRDGACSPIPDMNQQPPVLPQYQNRFRGSFHASHPRNVGQLSFAQRGSQKRSWPAMERDWRMSPKKQRDGRLPHMSPNESSTTASPGAYPNLVTSASNQSPADANFKYPQTTGQGSETNTADDQPEVNIKKEIFDNDSEKTSHSDHDPSQASDQETNEYSDEASKTNSICIKNDPDALTTAAEDDTHASDGASNHPSTDFKGTFLDPAASEDNPDTEQNKHEADEDDDDQLGTSHLAGKTSHDLEADNDQTAAAEDISAENMATGSDMPADYDEAGEEGAYPQSVYSDAGEGSSDNGQFEVIEIDDEDEDVQAMFGGSQLFLGRHPWPVDTVAASSSSSTSFNHMPGKKGAKKSTASTSYTGTGFSGAQSPMNKSWEENQATTGESYLACSHCSAGFFNKHDLKAHISSQHGQHMPYNCNLCGKGYQTSMGLIYHKRGHEGKVYPCPVCDAKLTRSSSLKSHLRSIHFVTQCGSCSGIFKLGYEYNEHVHHCVSK